MKNADFLSLFTQCKHYLSLLHVVLGTGNADFSPLLSCIASMSEQCKLEFGVEMNGKDVERSVFFRRSIVLFPPYWKRRRSVTWRNRRYRQVFLTTYEGIRIGAFNYTNFFARCTEF